MASLRGLLARASGLATLGALTWVFCFAHGCTDTRCDGSFATYGLEPGQGATVGPTSWESSAFEGTWLEFSHERLITFDLQRQVGQRRIVAVTPYIAPSETPANNGYFTIASGNLAVLHIQAPGWFTLRNDTCADYFVRVVVELEPEAPLVSGGNDGGMPLPDASTPDAAAGDASTPDGASDSADSASDGP